jgi:hypothetical protein
MLILSDDEVLRAVCSARNRWGIMAYIHFRDEVDVAQWRDEIMTATKGLIDTHTPEHYIVANQLVHSGNATFYLLFDTREEMEDAFFNRIYGDDNSDTHGYSGALYTIRCLTCTPSGELENENS